MPQLFINHKRSYDSVRSEVLYNIVIKLVIPVKLGSLTKMCLTETCSKVRIGKNLSGIFPVRNGLKEGLFYRLSFQLYFRLLH